MPVIRFLGVRNLKVMKDSMSALDDPRTNNYNRTNTYGSFWSAEAAASGFAEANGGTSFGFAKANGRTSCGDAGCKLVSTALGRLKRGRLTAAGLRSFSLTGAGLRALLFGSPFIVSFCLLRLSRRAADSLFRLYLSLRLSFRSLLLLNGIATRFMAVDVSTEDVVVSTGDVGFYGCAGC